MPGHVHRSVAIRTGHRDGDLLWRRRPHRKLGAGDPDGLRGHDNDVEFVFFVLLDDYDLLVNYDLLQQLDDLHHEFDDIHHLHFNRVLHDQHRHDVNDIRHLHDFHHDRFHVHDDLQYAEHEHDVLGPDHFVLVSQPDNHDVVLSDEHLQQFNRCLVELRRSHRGQRRGTSVVGRLRYGEEGARRTCSEGGLSTPLG